MLRKLQNYVLYAYLIIMLGIFPLFYRKQYSGMGNAKFKLFLYSSAVCIAVLIVLSILQYAVDTCKDFSTVFSRRYLTYSITDLFVIFYYGAVLCSFLFSDFKEEALLGAAGWSMGLAAQTVFFFSYFYLSRRLQFQKWILYVLFGSSGVVFLLGILHRFYLDPLGIAVGLSESQRLQFLSTIGQSSWYSSFICTVLPLGVFVFYASKNKRERIWSCLYTVLAFMTLVTQNTDSAYLALLAMLLVLFYVSFDSRWQMKRFWQLILNILASFKGMGLLQLMAGEHTASLDSLSIFMSRSMWTTALFILILCGYLFCYGKNRIPADNQPIKRTVFYVLAVIMSVSLAVLITFIVCNSNGFLVRKWGYCNTNNYLLFQNNWGNNRGFSWKFSMMSFKDFSVFRKLFGIGPDCFKAYHYGITEYAELLNSYWGGLSLTNAHNEYLTILLDLGIVGLLSFLLMLCVGLYRFVKNRKDNIYLSAFALVIAAYAAHNFFCYQQVCCTPFLFILMGIGENMIRNKEIFLTDKI